VTDPSIHCIETTVVITRHGDYVKAYHIVTPPSGHRPYIERLPAGALWDELLAAASEGSTAYNLTFVGPTDPNKSTSDNTIGEIKERGPATLTEHLLIQELEARK
jgi:hypothetical protein